MIESKDSTIVKNRINFTMLDSIRECKEIRTDGRNSKLRTINNRLKGSITKRF